MAEYAAFLYSYQHPSTISSLMRPEPDQDYVVFLASISSHILLYAEEQFHLQHSPEDSGDESLTCDACRSTFGHNINRQQRMMASEQQDPSSNTCKRDLSPSPTGLAKVHPVQRCNAIISKPHHDRMDTK
nr:hypothetical protein CFP56_01353 [Quercus suber]